MEMYHSEVCWLSEGKTLYGFCEHCHKIDLFLGEHGDGILKQIILNDD
jgi:hypothetical protein